jgi:hypothetical protein
VVECAGLEIRYTVLPYRGFESLLLRHQHQAPCGFQPYGAFFTPFPALFLGWTGMDGSGRRARTNVRERAEEPAPGRQPPALDPGAGEVGGVVAEEAGASAAAGAGAGGAAAAPACAAASVRALAARSASACAIASSTSSRTLADMRWPSYQEVIVSLTSSTNIGRRRGRTTGAKNSPSRKPKKMDSTVEVLLDVQAEVIDARQRVR